jgi:competence protein ComEC
MMFGLAAAAAIPLHPVGMLLARIALVPLQYLEWVARHLAHAPIPTLTATPGSVVPLLAAPIAVAAGLWIRARRRRPRARPDAAPGADRPEGRRTVRVAAVLCVALPVLVWTQAGWRPPGALTVVFFNVARGDAALLRSPGGAAILIDGGLDSQDVARRLAALGVHRLDVVVATVQREEQVGGLPAVLARIPTGLVLDPGCQADGPAYAAFAGAVAAAGAPFRHPGPGTAYHVGDVTLQVIGPPECPSDTSTASNDGSLVLRVSDGVGSILFAGTAGRGEQDRLVRDAGAALRAPVLQTSGEGDGEDLAALARAVGAGVVVVAAGAGPFEHQSSPGQGAAPGIRVFRTEHHDVTITFERGRLTVASAHG